MRKSIRGGKKILGKSLCLVTGTPPSRKGGESDTKCIRSGEVAGTYPTCLIFWGFSGPSGKVPQECWPDG